MTELNNFDRELLSIFGGDKFRIIINTKIGIAGCGGLGSNCAAFLVRSGFRKIKLVDFDSVEYSNLNRQFYFYSQKGIPKTEALEQNLKNINPSVELEIIREKIERDNIKNIFSDCDIIAEAFDSAEAKSMLASELMGKKKFIVSASGISGIGMSDNIVTRKIRSNFIIVGDFNTDSGKIPPFAPRVAIAAAKQADMILQYVLSEI